VALTESPYQRAVAAIEAVSWRGMKPGLERTEAVLAALGNPQQTMRGVLVAGTNGKGSVCAVVDSVLRAASLHTVLLTKPHLVSYRERIVIDGEWIDEAGFAGVVDAVTAVTAALDEELQPTGFEMLTAAGILAAANAGAGALVCEVGLGGRLDSTNVLDLGVAAVTNVGLDHQQHLGDTVTAIAREKAAIIKRGDIAITGAAEPALSVVRERCEQMGAPLHAVDVPALTSRSLGRQGVEVDTVFDGSPVLLHSPLIGRFQAGNLAVAAAVCDELRRNGMPIDVAALQAGCRTARWRGRMQWIDGTPPVLVDGAHNPDGMRAMTASLDDIRGPGRLAVVFAAMRDKDIASMADTLRGARPDAVFTTAPSVARAADPAELAALFGGAARAVAGSDAALDEARSAAGRDGLVVACGSLFLAGEVLSLLGA